MKIQCPNCNAVYKVSESKIPEKGTYAKCPECEHRFFVKRPGDTLKTQQNKSEVDFERELQLSSVEQLARDTAKTTSPKRARLPYMVFGAVLCLVAIAVIFLLLNQPDFDEGTAALDNHDYVTAIKIFRALAEQENADAQYNLAELYYKGKGVPQDYQEAFNWHHKAAKQGNAGAQRNLGLLYDKGQGIPQDYKEAVKWYRKAAEQGDADAQILLWEKYEYGKGVPKDDEEAAKWCRKAAEQGNADAQNNLGRMYYHGRGVLKDYQEAVKWYRKAAEQGNAWAQYDLGYMYDKGEGVPHDYVKAYMWYNLAAKNSKFSEAASKDFSKDSNLLSWANLLYPAGPPGEARDRLAKKMTSTQIARAQQMAREWPPKKKTGIESEKTTKAKKESAVNTSKLQMYGTGFVISKEGLVLTNYHIIKGAQNIRITGPLESSAKIIAYDVQNDLALVKMKHPLKVIAKFRSGKGIRMGDKVIVAGYPLRGILSGINITTGTVNAVSGPGNDSRILQISAPVQQGNSGGPLLDISGNVVGIVVARLSALKIAKLTGGLPQNVNFAIKGSIIRTFLDAHGVDYQSARSRKELETAEIGEHAKKFTVIVENWNFVEKPEK